MKRLEAGPLPRKISSGGVLVTSGIIHMSFDTQPSDTPDFSYATQKL
jgi:hypothetical protein